MRKFDPDFELWYMEEEAKVIFEDCFNQYLNGEMRKIEKVCGEAALGYFKVKLKLRDTNVYYIYIYIFIFKNN